MLDMAKPHTRFSLMQTISPYVAVWTFKIFSKLSHLNSYMSTNSIEVRNHVN